MSDEEDPKKDMLASLTPREAKILRERFGITMDSEFSLADVVEQFDLTRERISEFEKKALAKLRERNKEYDDDPD